MTAKRGRCPACRFRFPLRKAGTMQRHRIYSGNEGRVCEGSGKPAVPLDVNACPECAGYRWMTPGLVEACWSAGIEKGKDGDVLLREVLEAHHRNGHREPA